MASIVVKIRGREISRVPFSKIEMRVGRDRIMEVVLDNVGVSRWHATISYENGRFMVRDAESASGITVNGALTEELVVKYGDEIGLGKFILVLSDSGGTPLDQLTPADDAQPENVRDVRETLMVTAVEMIKLQQEQGLEGKELAAKRGPKPIEESERGGSSITMTLLLIVAILIIAVLASLLLAQ